MREADAAMSGSTCVRKVQRLKGSCVCFLGLCYTGFWALDEIWLAQTHTYILRGEIEETKEIRGLRTNAMWLLAAGCGIGIGIGIEMGMGREWEWVWVRVRTVSNSWPTI